ncbi:MAG TPA: nucleoid occlusion protein [Candidatus Monoglobus merdigallinarum]|uniref:Nucleoid occlusion protein n=1 Tax=Candidatus Monoglobus merdigallinarum TaxID=2838698 RepID=A0A9D1TMP6_9FIRM|nr:nucleoid occlusion protein [Candidatus Monoglobus merdigallinarum]
MLFDYLKNSRGAVEEHDSEVHELDRAELAVDIDSIKKAKRVTAHGNSQSIPINCIKPNPNQPRLEIDENALSELAASIENYGLMQPITVRQVIPFEYELVAGHRRLAACKLLGMDYIPAIVLKVGVTDSAVMALVENIQRENLSYMEEAEAYLALLSEHGLTQEELASKLGKSQSTIANKIRILKLPLKVRATLCEFGLTERHARALLKLKNEQQQLTALGEIVKKGLNVERTEALIERMLKKSKAEEESAKKPGHLPRTFKDIRIFSNTIKKAVELMNRSGVKATTKRRENDDYIEYTIKIPK